MSGRLSVVALAVLSLLAATSMASRAHPAAILRADGIGTAAAPVRFGTPGLAALSRLRPLLGPVMAQRTIPDCGQGEPMVEVTFKGHLVITTLHGRFSGWTLDGRGTYRTDKGVEIGSSRGAAIKAYPGTSVEDGSLGVLFTSEHGVSGFLNSTHHDARVIGLFAGETCMVS